MSGPGPIATLVIFWVVVAGVSIAAVIYGFIVGTGASYIIAALGCAGILSILAFLAAMLNQRRKAPGA